LESTRERKTAGALTIDTGSSKRRVERLGEVGGG